MFQLGQGSLGLQEREYYENETDITLAYRQFMQNLASALTNETTDVASDVIAMFLFEKQISQVGSLRTHSTLDILSSPLFSITGPALNNAFGTMKLFEPRLEIFPLH